ncbi:50S ribosomal protein L3 [Thermofilum pendens]|uniref:Large ribosomal subunit protein uL3 n=1 Tax=Thermofilum pendens (strain DSM 2475 / Hrk 5) TaxID=368408 RepID=A1RWR0_THEPD|nr:50S ribosomal protein L3 [Thermofilum pendens]ABL77640.1 LSU ribosomal protein L3P [Thermofilum pendens Hrk 5]
MAKGHRPRRGSRAYYPRKRARSIVARVRRWPQNREGFLGFAGYKVGMLHVIGVEMNKNSPFYGQERFYAATVIEVPPLKVVAVRVYEKTPYGKKTLCEVWAKDLPKDLERVFPLPKDQSYHEEQLKKLEEVKSRVSEVRVLAATQPRLSGLGKKKPELIEIAVGGPPEKALSLALEKLGKDLTISDVFKEGDYIDVIAVTKGKGFQGSVKRFGVEEMPRWHKHRKGHSRIGSVGPQKPAIMFYTPFPGQLGFHQRTEYNKRILKVGDAESLKEINPPGGWPHYGLVRSQFIIVEGSVPGAVKRLVRLRHAIRALRVLPPPQITYISTAPWPPAR